MLEAHAISLNRAMVHRCELSLQGKWKQLWVWQISVLLSWRLRWRPCKTLSKALRKLWQQPRLRLPLCRYSFVCSVLAMYTNSRHADITIAQRICCSHSVKSMIAGRLMQAALTSLVDCTAAHSRRLDQQLTAGLVLLVTTTVTAMLQS